MGTVGLEGVQFSAESGFKDGGAGRCALVVGQVYVKGDG